MNLMKVPHLSALCSIFILPVVFLAEIYDEYYVTPIGIVNHSSKTADLLQCYLYLQRINRTSIVVRGTLNVTKEVGPLAVNATLFKMYFGGYRVYKKYVNTDNFCVQKILPKDILQSFKPNALINFKRCTIKPGHFSMDMDFNKVMHVNYNIVSLGPVRMHYDFCIMENSHCKTLFAFTLDAILEPLWKNELAQKRITEKK